MSTALRSGPYRAFFYSEEGDEPPHVHVERGSAVAKFWLCPVRQARNSGFGEHEITRIRRILESHEAQLREAWDAHFGA